MVPQRLNVFELLIGRELVKPGRWQGRLRHDPSIRRQARWPTRFMDNSKLAAGERTELSLRTFWTSAREFSSLISASHER
jgi:hypothetical protein